MSRRILGTCVLASLSVFLAAEPTGAVETAAATASKRVSPRTEVEWEIAEIVAHIAEMASYARTKTLDPNVRVDVLDAPSEKGLWLAVQAGGLQAPLVAEIATGDFTISPEAYAGITGELLARLELRSQGTTKSDGAALLQRLTDFTLPQIQTENKRVSVWLTQEPLNPAAHDEAALILGTLALKEQAGTLYDNRDACIKASAHLAVATALRGGKPPELAGRLAREVILACYADDAGVADRLKMWRAAGNLSKGEEAWLNALTIRCIGDWHLLKQPLTASLLERIMHYRALCSHVNGLTGLDFLRKRNTEPIADWGQIAAPYGVETGNVFAKATLMLDLKDLAGVYEATKGRPPAQSDGLAAILAATATRAVEADDKGARLAAIPWSTWSRYFERHVIQAAVNIHQHLVLRLGLRDEGKALRLQMEQLLKGVEFQPLAAALFVDGKVGEDKGGRQMTRWVADPEVMRAAYAFIESHAERIPSTMWYYVTESGATHPPGARGYHAWFAVTKAGPLDVTHSPFWGYNLGSVPEARLDLLMARSPGFVTALQTGANRLKRAPTTLVQFDQLYSRLLDTDLWVMRQRLGWLWDDAAAFETQFKKVAALDPDEWFGLGDTFVGKGMEEKAADAYQHAIDEGRNGLRTCNNSMWLIDYYLEKGKIAEARKVATTAAEVECSAGFEAMAGFHESQKHFDDAERFYKKMAERYSEERALFAFYARHEGESERFKEAGAAGVKKLFPEGLARVKLSDFSGAPSDGVEVRGDTERSRRVGIVKGVVIGAVDGYRVRDLVQYSYIQGLSTKPEITLTYWDGKAWQETTGRGRLRRVGASMGTYTSKK